MFANAMEVFKLLDKSNCRKCNEATCLAFASKVFLGLKPLDMCPSIDPEVLKQYGGDDHKNSREEDQDKAMDELKQSLETCDLEKAAQRTGGKFEKNRLTLRILGKPFSLDNQGKIYTDLHTIPWLVGPVIAHVLHSQGQSLTGEWMAYREINGGREKNGLFVQRSEKSLKKIADNHPGLFEDLAMIFNGRETENLYDSDISMVLPLLPMIPMLICYWKPEEGMESDLRLFFDASASANAGADIIFNLAAGVVRMFEKLSKTHGWSQAATS